MKVSIFSSLAKLSQEFSKQALKTSTKQKLFPKSFYQSNIQNIQPLFSVLLKKKQFNNFNNLKPISSFCSVKQTISLLAQNSIYSIENEDTKKINKLLIEGKYNEAIESCKAILPTTKDPHRIRYILAYALKNIDQSSQAIEEFQNFIKQVNLSSDSTTGLVEAAHFELALLYQQRGQSSLSLLNAESAMELNVVLAVPQLIQEYINAGEIERGVSFLRRLQSRVSSNEQLPYLEGQLLEAKDDIEGCLKAYQKAIDLSPEQKHVEANLRIGLILKKQGDYENSTCFLIKAVESDENNYIARFNLGQNLRILGEGMMGKEHLEACLKIEPQNPSPYYDLALSYEQTGEMEKCIEFLEKNAQEFDRHVETVQRLTNIYAARGDQQKALKYIQIGIQSDAFLCENVDFMNLQELIKSTSQTDVSESVRIFKEIAKQLQDYHSNDKQKMQIVNFLTQLFLLFKRNELAIECEKILVLTGINELQHRVNLATLFRNTNQLNLAIEQYQILGNLLPSEPNYPYFCGQIQLQSGDVQAAIKSYAKSLQIQDGSDYCLFELAHCYKISGQTEFYTKINSKLIEYFPEFYKEEAAHVSYIQSLKK